jgi:hypothetical protein
MKDLRRIIVLTLIRNFIIPLIAMAVWNKIAWEFNLPQFNFWIFWGISILIMLGKICKLFRDALQYGDSD